MRRPCKTDIETSNGVIHGIDSVLIPPKKTASAEAREKIRNVVAKGCHLYNSGHIAACSKLYMTSLEELHADYAEKMSPTLQRSVQHTLMQAKHLNSHDSRAWMLRHTLDAVYSTMQPIR